MATNVFGNSGGVANILLARVNASFASMGLNAGNMTVIYEVHGAAASLKSWKPQRVINPIFGMVAGRGYYLIALQDMDLSEYVYPPLTEIPADEEFSNDEFG